MSGPFGPVQALVRGFFGMMGLKNMGQIPDTILGQIQPGIDMEDWWKRSQAYSDPTTYTVTLAAGGSTAISFTTPLIVPSNEVWWVESLIFDVSVPAAAGEFIEECAPVIAYEVNPSTLFGFLTRGISLTGAAANTTHGQLGARDFWLPGGSEIRVYCGRRATATQFTIAAWIRAARFQS